MEKTYYDYFSIMFQYSWKQIQKHILRFIIISIDVYFVYCSVIGHIDKSSHIHHLLFRTVFMAALMK
jgi:hypothetical protein